MTPVQILKLGIGDEGVQVPLYRLPYLGGGDGAAAPGGFFTTKDGELGVVLDFGLDGDAAQKFISDELRKAAPAIAALLASKKQTTDGNDSKTPRESATPAS